MKKLALFLAVVLLLGCFAGCGQSGGEAASSEPPAASSNTGPNQTPGGAFDAYARPRMVEDGKVKIGYLHSSSIGESIVRWQNQIEIEVAHRGWELVDIACETDMQVLDGIRSLINQDVDAILIGSAESMETKTSLIQEAREAGIGVYCLDNQIVDGVISNVTMPNSVAAMEMFDIIAADLGYAGSFILIGLNFMQISPLRLAPIEGLLTSGAYPNMGLLEYDDVSDAPLDAVAADLYDRVRRYNMTYDQIDGIICFSDNASTHAAEGLIQSGDTAGKKTFVAGFDGGMDVWSYIREDTPLKYSYAQPFERFMHIALDIIEETQILGLNPGDEGATLSRVGEVITVEGFVVTRDNVPDVGQSIHAVFDYYGGSPDDSEAWYNWTDGPGIYMIQGGAE